MKIILCNILYPTPSHPKVVGGAERSTRNLAEAFVRAGHDVLILCSHEADEALFDEVVNGVRVISRKIRNYYWPFDGRSRFYLQKAIWQIVDNFPRAPRGFDEDIAAFRPDIIYTANIIGITWDIWRLARRHGIPIVHILRDYYLACGRSARFRNGESCTSTCPECRIATFQRGPRTELVDAVIGISEHILSIHLKENLFTSVRQATVIPNIAPARQRELHVETNAIVFGYIGRASPEKGLERLAEAIGHLPGSCRLVIAGDIAAEHQRNLETLAGRSIEFMGFVDPAIFYGYVDVVVVPSLWAEPLSRAILEAQSFGLPAIGSNRGGIPEAIGNTGAGWIFDPDEPGALARIMANLASDPAQVRNAAFQARHAAERFSEAAVVGQHEKLMRALV